MVSSIPRFPRERMEFRGRNWKVVGTCYISTCSLLPQVASHGLDWVKCRDEDLAAWFGGLAWVGNPCRQVQRRRREGTPLNGEEKEKER